MIQILLAVYNGEKFIEEQISSIMLQSYSDIHLVLRDNHSSDKTVQIIESLSLKYPGKISLIKSSKNDGVIGNFAKLAEYSTAPYIMFSDADDIWHKDKVLKSILKMKELEKKQGEKCPLLVHTDLTVVDRDLNVIHPSFWRYSKLNPLKGSSLARQLVQNSITGCTTMVNRPLLDLALPFPESIVMHDWWLGLIAASIGKIEAISEPTMLYRQHGNNDTGAKKYGLKSFLKRMKEKEKVRNNLEKKFAQACELKIRLSSKLSSHQQQLLDKFISLKNTSFWAKRYAIFKNGFYKQGFLRNVIEFMPYEWFLKR